MSGNDLAGHRLLFPLMPVAAMLALCLGGAGLPSKNALLGAKNDLAQRAPLPAMLPQKTPLRPAVLPKYQIKFSSFGRGAVDYDAGSQMVTILCSFEDQSPELPVVGMSDLGLLTRLQTDSGMLVEGGSGFGVINPKITAFKNAPFTLRAKIPLATKTLRAVNGSITVLRARERAALTWRAPFAAALGTVRQAGGFEFTLAKCEVKNDELLAEWTCKVPAEFAKLKGLWTARQLKAAVDCADKSVIQSEAGVDTPAIRRVFHLRKKAPAALELSFVSDLKLENLPFELSGIALDGKAIPKAMAMSGDQNF